MDSDEIAAKGSVDSGAAAEYSVNGYSGVSIDSNGLLTITPSANAGNVNASAKYGANTKTLSLKLKALGNADKVEIYGDEVITAGADNVTKAYKAIPLAEGIVLPARETRWKIVGDAAGVTVDSGGNTRN